MLPRKRLVPISDEPQLAVSPFPGGSLDELTDDEGLSLEELSRSYHRVLGGTALPDASESAERDDRSSAPSSAAEDLPELADEPADSDSQDCPLTPQSIVEAILFIGRPDGQAVTTASIAALMRGVEAEEVDQCVTDLNEVYLRTGRAIQIVASGAGYRVQLADDLISLRERFYGSVRQVRLNQAAIDCLALIAYQPGIDRHRLEQQRGAPSGSVLTQLIRRQLIEMRRETAAGESLQRYYPTQRLLELASLESLDDLPQVEEFE